MGVLTDMVAQQSSIKPKKRKLAITPVPPDFQTMDNWARSEFPLGSSGNMNFRNLESKVAQQSPGSATVAQANGMPLLPQETVPTMSSMIASSNRSPLVRPIPRPVVHPIAGGPLTVNSSGQYAVPETQPNLSVGSSGAYDSNVAPAQYRTPSEAPGTLSAGLLAAMNPPSQGTLSSGLLAAMAPPSPPALQINPIDTNPPASPMARVAQPRAMAPAPSPMAKPFNPAPASLPSMAARMAATAAPVPTSDQSVENIRGVMGMPKYEAGDRIVPGFGGVGNMLVDSTTGAPKAMLRQQQAGIADGNAMADAALERRRLTTPANSGYGSGLGSGVAPINVLAEQDRRAKQEAFNQDYYATNKEFYANKRRQAMQEGISDPAASSTIGNTTVALIGNRAQEAEANRNDFMTDTDRNRKLAAYNERLRLQRDQANQAQGLRARMAAGKPLNQEEANMFANQAAMQQEAALSGMLARTNPAAALQAMGNRQQTQAKAAQSLQEMALKGKLADAQIASSGMSQEIEMQRLANEQAKQNFLQSPEGVRNGMLLGGATAKEIQDAGLPLPQASTTLVSTAPTTASIVAGTQANQQMRTLPPDAQLASLEGLLRASQAKGFNVNDAISAGVDEQTLMSLGNRNIDSFDPNFTLGSTLDNLVQKDPITTGLLGMIPASIKDPIANIKPLKPFGDRSPMANRIAQWLPRQLGAVDTEEALRRAELQRYALSLADMIKSARKAN
jgi:hypothetical protein